MPQYVHVESARSAVWYRKHSMFSSRYDNQPNCLEMGPGGPDAAGAGTPYFSQTGVLGGLLAGSAAWTFHVCECEDMPSTVFSLGMPMAARLAMAWTRLKASPPPTEPTLFRAWYGPVRPIQLPQKLYDMKLTKSRWGAICSASGLTSTDADRMRAGRPTAAASAFTAARSSANSA